MRWCFAGITARTRVQQCGPGHGYSYGCGLTGRRNISIIIDIHENLGIQPEEPGTIVEMEIGIWPMGTILKAGESVRVVVS